MGGAWGCRAGDALEGLVQLPWPSLADNYQPSHSALLPSSCPPSRFIGVYVVLLLTNIATVLYLAWAVLTEALDGVLYEVGEGGGLAGVRCLCKGDASASHACPPS